RWQATGRRLRNNFDYSEKVGRGVSPPSCKAVIFCVLRKRAQTRPRPLGLWKSCRECPDARPTRPQTKAIEHSPRAMPLRKLPAVDVLSMVVQAAAAFAARTASDARASAAVAA